MSENLKDKLLISYNQPKRLGIVERNVSYGAYYGGEPSSHESYWPIDYEYEAVFECSKKEEGNLLLQRLSVFREIFRIRHAFFEELTQKISDPAYSSGTPLSDEFIASLKGPRRLQKGGYKNFRTFLCERRGLHYAYKVTGEDPCIYDGPLSPDLPLKDLNFEKIIKEHSIGFLLKAFVKTTPGFLERLIFYFQKGKTSIKNIEDIKDLFGAIDQLKKALIYYYVLESSKLAREMDNIRGQIDQVVNMDDTFIKHLGSFYQYCDEFYSWLEIFKDEVGKVIQQSDDGKSKFSPTTSQVEHDVEQKEISIEYIKERMKELYLKVQNAPRWEKT